MDVKSNVKVSAALAALHAKKGGDDKGAKLASIARKLTLARRSKSEERGEKEDKKESPAYEAKEDKNE